jgi:sporulation protein YlmC with PRC-barrel domain
MDMIMRSAALLAFVALLFAAVPACAAGPTGGAHTQAQEPSEPDQRTPEERMNARFPQKVRVSDLIGIPVQDYDSRIIGYVTDVVRKPDGKIVLVMPEGGWFWRRGRPVPIPIEAVAIVARHVTLLDIPRENVPKLPTWNPAQGGSIDRNETIRMAIDRH